LRLERRVHGLSAAEELVQSKREDGKARVWPAVAEALHQRVFDRGSAVIDGAPRQECEEGCGSFLAVDGSWHRPDQAAAIGLGGQAEGGLAPRCERIGKERVVVPRLLAVDAGTEGAKELFVVSRRHGRAPQRLADDVLGLDLVTEDERGDPSDLPALLL